MLPELKPRTTHPPAQYKPAEKKLLDRPCTMDDVADFVTEYIYSDVSLLRSCRSFYMTYNTASTESRSNCNPMVNHR